MSRIAILYPGALGAALGRAIVRSGGTAITCLSGRSEATRHRAVAADFVVVPSLEEVARQSDLVISLVSPTSALEAARCFAEKVGFGRYTSTNPRPIFVDLNSASPQTKQDVAETLYQAGIHCLDGAFFGPASRIDEQNVIALAGPGAEEVALLLEKVVEVRCLGERIGQAAALKMALAIMTKALPALFLEMVCASAKHDQLVSMLELMRRLYPGIMDFLERVLPTYPTHIGRRVFELTEVGDWLRESCQTAVMTEGAVTILERLRNRSLSSNVDWRFEDLLRAIGESDLLSTIERVGTDSDPAGETLKISTAK